MATGDDIKRLLADAVDRFALGCRTVTGEQRTLCVDDVERAVCPAGPVGSPPQGVPAFSGPVDADDDRVLGDVAAHGIPPRLPHRWVLPSASGAGSVRTRVEGPERGAMSHPVDLRWSVCTARTKVLMRPRPWSRRRS